MKIDPKRALERIKKIFENNKINLARRDFWDNLFPMKINGPLAKDITREIVSDLYSRFISDKQNVEVFSLPGEVWKFEEHVLLNHYTKGLKFTNLVCFENDLIKYNLSKSLHARIRLRNFLSNQNFNLKLNSIHTNNNLHLSYEFCPITIDQADDKTEFFGWFDYCGNPSQDRLNNFDEKYKYNNVQIFTFCTAWRCVDNIPDSIIENAKEIGNAKAIIKYFSDKIVNTNYKILFNIEYISNHTPMILIAITNDKSILNDITWQKYSDDKFTKKKKRSTKNNPKRNLSLVYKDLHNNLNDNEIIKNHNINKNILAACKAHITMGNR